MSENEKGFDIHEAANEILAESEPQESATLETETPVSDTQETAPQENTGESKELTPEEILAKMSEEKESEPVVKDETAILNQINSLGAVHNGQPVKIENVNQLKELIQKGYDYTKKTMAHSEEVKAWKENIAKTETELTQKTAQLQEYETKLSDTILENQIAEAVLLEMQSTDPEMFEEFKVRYTNELNRRNQALPYLKQFESQFEKLNGEIQGLKQGKQQAELSNIKNTWEKDLSTVQGKFAPQLGKLGVKVDWDKVQKTWASDASNSMTVEQALFATYGSEITKANESYQKLLATKNKTNNTMLKRTGAGASAGSKEPSTNFGGNYEALLRETASNM